MAHESAWLYPGRIIQIRYFDVVTRDDLGTQSDTTQAMIAAGEAPVHIIVDLISMTKMDVGLNELRQILSSKDHSTTAMVGWTLVLRHNSLVQFFASMAIQLLKARFTFVDTLDEALAFLRERDATLSDMPVNLAITTDGKTR